ncbi:hypothetical protein M2D07_014375 [Pseudomonas sp. BGr12]|uniref:hypothetical protein n=1 Tax=unclassified Pseudomonas TaxID=196821 RepID=UPI00178740DB|nr:MULTISPECIES: hypothetical protein [unclassified Pseudomonas]MBD9500887.1 hypothetical protein [Pseudomonas sp. PDM17]MDL2428200.1 hypothetical protein [Pseudomonas sp. BJa5]
MPPIFSKGTYELFTPGGVGKRIGVLRNGRVELLSSPDRFRVYANHLFIELDGQDLGECIGEIDASGQAQWLDGRALFHVIPVSA